MNPAAGETTASTALMMEQSASAVDAAQPVRPQSGSSRFSGWKLAFAVCLAACGGVGLWCWHISYLHSLVSLHQECRKLSAQEHWDELAVRAEQWAKLEPNKADPWLFSAEAAEGQQDWNQLVEVLSRVPPSDRRAPVSWLRKATVEFEYLNRPWDGIRSCDRVLELDPRILIAHKQSIFFHAMTLQRAELVSRIRRAIEVRRESPEAYVFLISATWLYSGSLYRHNTHWLEADPSNETFRVAQALQIYASDAKQDREFANEFEHIPTPETLLEQYPHNLELVAFLLKQSISSGDVDRVEELLERIPTELAERDPRCIYARAWLQETSGAFADAEISLMRAYALDPYWWQVHYQLHDLMRRMGRKDESAHYLRIYEVSHDLAIQITRLNRSENGFDDPKFCAALLKLAELVQDKPVIAALRERVAAR